MRKKQEYPAHSTPNPNIGAISRKILALLLALMICFAIWPAWAESGDGADQAPPDGESLPDDFGPSEGDSASYGGSTGFTTLTEENFNADDVPDEYLTESARPGRVEKLRYTTTGEEPEVKSAMVYLPAEYDETDKAYNVLYILHAASGKPKNYLDPSEAKDFQCLLDHMIEAGDLEPLIVVAATYYPTEGFTQFLPLAKQVEVAAEFPRELTVDIRPAVEEKYRTWAASSSEEDLILSRDHRAIAGFSLGGVTTWYVFLQQMRMFKWFLPISEASWADAEGGTSGIWDSDVSAQVLYDAVLEQGYGRADFRLFVATGTDDEAFDVSTSQMVSLLEYSDLFQPGENTSCSMMMGGTHTLTAVYTYLYHILPALFAD